MNNTHFFVAIVGVALLCLGGCGQDVASQGKLQANACDGATITGSLRDTLTNQPISNGRVFLEAGSSIAGTPVLSFSVEQDVATLPDGSFQVCSHKTQEPQAIVAVARDAANEAYPPLLVPVSTAADLGQLLMGSCSVKCAFEGQQQSSAPATLTGSITTAPGAGSGSVEPHYAIAAPNSSKQLWDLAMPFLNSSQPRTFQTAESGCAGAQLPCSSYTFVLPSQKPVVVQPDESMQQVGAPGYSVLATVTGGSSCVPALASTSFQQDGVSPLTGAPGASLSAAAIHFDGCH